MESLYAGTSGTWNRAGQEIKSNRQNYPNWAAALPKLDVKRARYGLACWGYPAMFTRLNSNEFGHGLHLTQSLYSVYYYWYNQ